MIRTRSIKLSDEDWDALEALAPQLGVSGRTAAIRALIAGGVKPPEAPQPDPRPHVAVRAKKEATRGHEPAPGHIHTFVRHMGTSGLAVWTCDCGERRLQKPT